MAERQVGADDLPGDRICTVERTLNVLERFGRTPDLPAPIRLALRIQTMKLVDELEIEQGKQRLLDGNFAAARYHLAAARQRSLKLRLTLVAMRVAPQLVRAVYTALRPWTPHTAS